ncbi:hypothetical protein ACYOEI_03660 [Singulisphaera rosea]
MVDWSIEDDFPDSRSAMMETQKVLCYTAMAIAGIVCLIFLLDATVKVLGGNLVLDILFILGGAFVLWQGFETSRELR